MLIQRLVLSVFALSLLSGAQAATDSLNYLYVDQINATVSPDRPGYVDIQVSGTNPCGSDGVQSLRVYTDPVARLVRLVALGETTEGPCNASSFDLKLQVQLAPGPWALTTNHGRKKIFFNSEVAKKEQQTLLDRRL